MMRSGPAPNWTIYLLLVGLFVLFVNHQCYKTDPNSQEWGVMTNELYNFSFEYPLKWRAEVFGENGLRGYKVLKATINGNGLSIIDIYLQQSDSPHLEDAIQWGENRVQENATETNSKYEELEMTIEGKTAKRLYLYNNRTVMPVFVENFSLLKCQDIYIAREGDFIVINMCVPELQYDDYLPYFERIVDSFTPK